MKIDWIEFENLSTGLKIERINFFEDITLLVGLSGAGKSQILNAVEYSLNLAVRNNIILKPYSVTLSITIGSNNYQWAYQINKADVNSIVFENHEDNNGYIITHETLSKNGELIFERNPNDIIVAGYNKVPQPKKNESLLLQYSEDEAFEELISGIRKLHSIEMELEVRGRIKSDTFNYIKNLVSETLEQDPQTQFATFSKLPVVAKLFIAKKYYPTEYIRIFDAVKDLFIEIDDIDIVEDKKREIYLVAITVYGKQILQSDISSGMLKTIYYFVELFTMSKDSLVLIDEFENGLGVNCIDLLSEMLLSQREDLQFIITSHHPKIINGIEQNKWKIIDREINIIKNSNCAEYGIGNSKHDAYFNLINRWEYEGKI